MCELAVLRHEDRVAAGGPDDLEHPAQRWGVALHVPRAPLGQEPFERLVAVVDQLPGVRMSDAANRAVERAKKEIFVPDWKKVFEHDEIAESIQRIT